jgi:hypothetical protein
LLLDIALEGWLRLLVERADKRALATPDLVVLLGLVLDSAALTVRLPEGGAAGRGGGGQVKAAGLVCLLRGW